MHSAVQAKPALRAKADDAAMLAPRIQQPQLTKNVDARKFAVAINPVTKLSMMLIVNVLVLGPGSMILVMVAGIMVTAMFVSARRNSIALTYTAIIICCYTMFEWPRYYADGSIADILSFIGFWATRLCVCALDSVSISFFRRLHRR